MPRPQFAHGTFTTTSGPALVNLNLGFVPDFFMCFEKACSGTDKNWLIAFPSVDTGTGFAYTMGTGLDDVSSSFITAYQPSLTEVIKNWAASTAYVVGDYVKPLAPIDPSVVGLGEQYAFKCTTAGTSGSSEPTWSTDGSSTVSDNSVTWTPEPLGGTGTDFTPSQAVSGPLGVSIPAAQLVASKTYDYIAMRFSD